MRPEEITHCMPPHDLSLAILTTYSMRTRKKQWREHTFLSKLCLHFEETETPSFRITPHSNNSNNNKKLQFKNKDVKCKF